LKTNFIKAGALVYAIFIMLITLVVIGTLITIAYYHRTYIISEQAKQNLVSYTNSILTAAITDSTLSFPWEAKSLELTENEKYSFNVTKHPWGGFQIFTATSTFSKFTYEKKVMCGAKGVIEDNIALYLADNNNAISISGNTQLIGNCYLPKSGIKAAYMEGDYYRGKKLVYGDILVSNNSLPAFNTEYLASVTELLEGKIKSTDSIIDFTEIKSTEFTNSFYQKTLYFVSKDSLYLNNCKFIGNIVIICSKPVTIFSNAEFADVMLFAPKITIKKGVIANLQAYASDTLILEPAVHLTFPSIVAVTNNKNLGLIELKRKARIDGTLWMTKNSGEKENSNACFMYPETYLHGSAYIEGKISLQGNIDGALYAEKFFLKTVASYYENYIFNVKINAYNRLPYYSSATLDNKRGFRTIKTLEP
jgi:hypothetical protein